MPTDSLRPQTLADRLQALAERLRALAGQAAMQGRTLAEAKPLRTLRSSARWQVVAAAATALVLLTMYVMTLQAAVERGEALREQRRQQGITTFGAGSPPAGVQTASPDSSRS